MQTNLHKGLFHNDIDIIAQTPQKMQATLLDEVETAMREHGGGIYIPDIR
ncbi:MAG: hypothetical protein WCG28_03905 [bacterium]